MEPTAYNLLLAFGRTAVCSTLAAGIAWILLTKLRIGSPRVHRIACVLVIAQGWLLFPYTIQFEVSTKNPATTIDIVREQTIDQDQATLASGSRRPTTFENERPADLWTLGLVALWTAGTAVLVCRYVKNYASVLYRLPLGSPPSEKQWLTEWDRVVRDSNVQKKAGFRITKDIGPLLCFIPFSYLVLAPRLLWSRLDPRQREAILKHELAHLTRGDLWKSVAIRVLALPQWFNPFVWWAVRRFDEAGEWACDDLAGGATGQDESTYAKALLRVAEFATTPAPGAVAARGGVLSQRITRLITPRFKEETVMKKMIVPTLLMFLAAAQLIRIEAVAGDEQRSPSGETNAKVDQESYVVEPPDVLLIRMLHAEPKAELKLHAGDSVQITAREKESGKRLVVIDSVASDGKLELGGATASIEVAGLTLKESIAKISDRLTRSGFSSPIVDVVVLGLHGVDGKHLVSPDGKLDLGRFGTVAVGGMTTDEIREAIEKKLSDRLDKPRVYVDVAVSNSRAFYIIFTDAKTGDSVTRVALKSRTTVLDALASAIYPHPINLGRAEIRISRPTSDGLSSQQLSVDWNAITQSDDHATNHRLLPGDRIFVSPIETRVVRPIPDTVWAAVNNPKLEGFQPTPLTAGGAARQPHALPTPATRDNIGHEKREVRLDMKIIQDSKDNLKEFDSLKKKDFMYADSSATLGALRILEKNKLIEVLTAPAITVHARQTASLSVVAEPPAGSNKSQQIVEVEVTPVVHETPYQLPSVEVEIKTKVTLQGKTTAQDTRVIVGHGKTVILRVLPSPLKGKLNANGDAAVYVVITPKLLK